VTVSAAIESVDRRRDMPAARDARAAGRRCDQDSKPGLGAAYGVDVTIRAGAPVEASLELKTEMALEWAMFRKATLIT
jgi:hypothetical protein